MNIHVISIFRPYKNLIFLKGLFYIEHNIVLAFYIVTILVNISFLLKISQATALLAQMFLPTIQRNDFHPL